MGSVSRPITVLVVLFGCSVVYPSSYCLEALTHSCMPSLSLSVSQMH